MSENKLDKLLETVSELPPPSKVGSKLTFNFSEDQAYDIASEVYQDLYVAIKEMSDVLRSMHELHKD